jgi:hypothetical protein
MDRQRRTTASNVQGSARLRGTDRTYSRRDAILLGASAAFGLVGAAMARSVLADLASPMTAAALPRSEATPEATPIDVTPNEQTTRILTEVPMSGAERDRIAAEAARFATFGAGTVVTVRKDWHAPDGDVSAVAVGRIDLAEELFGDDPWTLARQDVELPIAFARSAVVNLLPRDDNGDQLRTLGGYLTTLMALQTAIGRDEALAVLNPYTYVDRGLRAEADWQRARARMEDPDALFATVVATLLRFPEELVAAIDAMPSDGGALSVDPSLRAAAGVADSPAKRLAKQFLRAVADLLVALVPNPENRGSAYVNTRLDEAIPRFGITRFDLGIGE